MNIKSIATAAIAALVGASTFAAAPANASKYGLLPASHHSLLEAVYDAGVDIYVNPNQVCGGDAPVMGMYISRSNPVMVICQDERTGETETTWTANDLDTLRHEAQHLVQDCHAGSIGDATLANVFQGEDLWNFLGQSSLTVDNFRGIESTYRNAGADDHTVLLEFEAFAVAADVPADSIGSAVNNICGINR